MRVTDAQIARCPGCGAWSITGRACDVCLTLYVYGDQTGPSNAPRAVTERSRGTSDRIEERKSA